MTDLNSLKKIAEYLVMIIREMMTIEEHSVNTVVYSDLTINDMQTLLAIGLSGKTKSSQLAEALNVTIGTVSVNVKRLVNKGLVERSRDQDDRRIIHLVLTKEGRRVYRVIRRSRDNLIKNSLTDLTTSQIKVLIKGLSNINDYLGSFLAEECAVYIGSDLNGGKN